MIRVNVCKTNPKCNICGKIEGNKYCIEVLDNVTFFCDECLQLLKSKIWNAEIEDEEYKVPTVYKKTNMKNIPCNCFECKDTNCLLPTLSDKVTLSQNYRFKRHPDCPLEEK